VTSRIQPLEMSARPMEALRFGTPRCQIARQLKKESNMPSGRLIFVGFWRDSGADRRVSANRRQPLFLLSVTTPTSSLSKTI